MEGDSSRKKLRDWSPRPAAAGGSGLALPCGEWNLMCAALCRAGHSQSLPACLQWEPGPHSLPGAMLGPAGTPTGKQGPSLRQAACRKLGPSVHTSPPGLVYAAHYPQIMYVNTLSRAGALNSLEWTSMPPHSVALGSFGSRISSIQGTQEMNLGDRQNWSTERQSLWRPGGRIQPTRSPHRGEVPIPQILMEHLGINMQLRFPPRWAALGSR